MIKMFKNAKVAALLCVSLSLFSCVEINGKAEVSDKGHVKVETTYDFSKVFNNIKAQNPAFSDRMEGFDCKIFVSDSPNFKCEDQGLLKYKMSDEVDKPVGVMYNEATGELSFDAVKYFAQVTDIKSMVQRSNAQGALISSDVRPLLPLESARRQTYLNEGLSIVLKVHFANEIVRIDEQEVSKKDHDITINFMDIADKPSYVIVTRAKPTVAWGSWIFVLLILVLLALAVWFLWRKKNSPPPAGTPSAQSSVPNQPAPSSPKNEANDTTDKPTRGERFAQAISAAAVGVGGAAMGSGANHTVEEVIAHEDHDVKQDSKPTDAHEPQ